MKKKLNDPGLKTAALVFLIVLGFILGFFLSGPIVIWPRNYLSPEEAAYRTILFLQQEFVEDETPIEILSIEEHYNLYRLKIDVGGQKFLSYLTRDGKLLFPDVLDLDPPRARSLPQQERPEVELFVEALSPVSSSVISTMADALDPIKEDIDIKIRYIVTPDLDEDKCLDEEQRYCSNLGVPEVRQAIRELCVAKHQPEALWEYILAVRAEVVGDDSGDVAFIEDSWRDLASDSGVDLSLLENCVDGEYSVLLEEQIALREQKYPVRVPRHYVDAFGQYQTESIISRVPVALVVNGMIYGQGDEIYLLDDQSHQHITCLAFSEKNLPEFCREIQEEDLAEEPQEELEELMEELPETEEN